MDVQEACSKYVQDMLSSVAGIKALLLDDETAGVVGLSVSQTEITRHDVYLVERLNKRSKRDDSRKHLKALVFVRPTAENTLLLRKELTDPAFGDYYIFFSNAIRRTLLEDLAEADVHEKVVEVMETFADAYTLGPQLFSLNVSPCVDATKGMMYNALFDRTVDGLFSILVALKKKPIIRFDESSSVCRNLAERLSVRVDQEHNLFGPGQPEEPPVLLILDRKEDPVTPLLNQWTYEAMVHEILAMKNNRVVVKDPADQKNVEEVVLDARTDQFYRRNMYLNFGELGDNVKHLVDSFQAEHRTHDRLDSIDDMMRFVEHYPEFKKFSNNVAKHVTLLGTLSKIVNRNQLLEVSQLEQDIACRESEVEHRQAVQKMLKSYRIAKEDKLRLVLLYSLRYEQAGDRHLNAFIQGLYEAGLGSESVALIKALNKQAGSQMRSGDVFNNKSFLAKARNTVKRGFGGVANVYTQHEPLLSSILDETLRGRLRVEEYPVVHGTPPRICKDVRPAQRTEVIVFFVGGFTCEESHCVAEINGTCASQAPDNSFVSSARTAAKASGSRIVLGGSMLHNSKSFLHEVAKKSSIM